MKLLLAACVFAAPFLANCKDKPSVSPVAYQHARFVDSGRMDKAQAVFEYIEKTYREHAISNQYPGLSFGVVVDGNLVFSGNYGVTDVQKKTPVTEDSLFRIASMSKSVTAVALLQLRDKGKLQLDDPASRYLPELKKVKYLTTDSPAITVRDLLVHSAGFPEDNPWGDFQLEDSEKDLIKLVQGGLTFSNPPGHAFEYSNLGFALLGRIISQISGMPYQRYVDQKVFAPLDMPSTEWEFTKVPAHLLAHGYRWEDEQWKEERLLHDGAFGAMGGLISSVNEFSRYMALHMEAWPPRDGHESKVLKRSSLREMHQPWRISGFLPEAKSNGTNCPTMLAYGYGLRYSRDCKNVVDIGHSGGLPGFGSNWRILPEYGVGVVAFANKTYANLGAANAKAINILLAAGLEPRKLPVSSILQLRMDQLLTYLPEWNEATNSHIFAENLFKDFSVERRRKAFQEAYSKAGRIKTIHPIQPLNNLRGTFIAEGTDGNVEVYFTLTPENPPLIQQLNVKFIPVR